MGRSVVGAGRGLSSRRRSSSRFDAFVRVECIVVVACREARLSIHRFIHHGDVRGGARARRASERVWESVRGGARCRRASRRARGRRADDVYAVRGGGATRARGRGVRGDVSSIARGRGRGGVVVVVRDGERGERECGAAFAIRRDGRARRGERERIRRRGDARARERERFAVERGSNGASVPRSTRRGGARRPSERAVRVVGRGWVSRRAGVTRGTVVRDARRRGVAASARKVRADTKRGARRGGARVRGDALRNHAGGD